VYTPYLPVPKLPGNYVARSSPETGSFSWSAALLNRPHTRRAFRPAFTYVAFSYKNITKKYFVKVGVSLVAGFLFEPELHTSVPRDMVTGTRDTFAWAIIRKRPATNPALAQLNR
jgi:hypothetical protein